MTQITPPPSPDTAAEATAVTPAAESKPAWYANFGNQVIMGLIAGIVLGLIARTLTSGGEPDGHWLGVVLKALGSTYVQLLKLLIPVLVVTAVITSVANLRKVANAARLALSTLWWFAITAFFSVIAGIVVAVIIRPGVGTGIDGAAAAGEPSTTGSWLGFLTSVVPKNILGLSASAGDSGVSLSFNVLQILVISLAFGIAAVKAGEKAEPFLAAMEGLLAIVQTVLWWIIRLAPIGTAALLGNAINSYGWSALSALGKFVIALHVGLVIVLVVIYPVVLLVNGIPVLEFFRRVWPVTSLGFVTRSSMGVMPVNQTITEKRMGVPREYASFAIPLGATTKMDGCAAVYPAVAAIFVAQFYGIELGITEYALIVLVSVLGSAATAGTTGATVMLTLTLSTLGLPLAGVGLLLAVEPIIDMSRTAVNVTGQSLAATVVAKRAGIVNESVWK